MNGTLNREKPLLVRASIQKADGSTSIETVRWDDVPDRPEPVHKTLPDDLRERATKLFHRIAPYSSPELSLEDFLDKLRYDAHPNREIAIWECVAAAFDATVGDIHGILQKRANARALVGISMGIVDVSAHTGLSDKRIEVLRQALDDEYAKIECWPDN